MNPVDVLVGDISDELFAHGVPNDRNMLSASALVSQKHHTKVVDAYQAYIKAGATMLVTANADVVPGVGFTADEIREYTQLAGALTRETRQSVAGGGANVKICGLLPPLMPGFRSDRTVGHQDGIEAYAVIGEALLEYADVYLAAPMSSLREAKMAFEAVEHLEKPIMISFALSRDGQLRSGEDVLEVIGKMLEFCNERALRGHPTEHETSGSSELTAILFSCSQPEDIVKMLKQVHECKALTATLHDKGIRLGGFGDRISPMSQAGQMESKLVSGEMRPVMDKELFANFTLRWIEFGADIVGGCCGVSPEYIANVVSTVRSERQSVGTNA